MELPNSFTAMIYPVMCKDTVHKKVHKILIETFHTCCHRFCKEYYSATVKEFWVNKQHFISYLNLPDQIEMFGSVSLSWDGTFEVIIGEVKALLNLARTNSNSLLPGMVLLHKKYAVHNICKRIKWHRSNRVMLDRMIWRNLISRDDEEQKVMS